MRRLRSRGGICISKKDNLKRRSFLRRLGYLGLAALSSAAIILGIVTHVRWSYVVFIDPRDRNLVKARNSITGTIDYSSQDATSVILDVIGALGNGGSILLQSGTYALTRSLLSTDANGVELYGEGNSTILRLANGVNERAIRLRNVRDWYIHDLQVDGNKVNQDGGSQLSHGVSAVNCTNIVVQRNYIHDCRTFGIQLCDSTNCRVLNNFVKDSGANGISVDNEGGGQTTLVQGNVVDGFSDVGISTWHGIDVTIDNNTISNANLKESPFAENGGQGISAEHSSQNITISSNTVNNCHGVGISTNPVAPEKNGNIQLLSNQINNCGTGVYLGRTEGVVAKGNTIDTTRGRGIVVDILASSVKIVDNQLSNIGGQSGIEGMTDGLLIDENTLEHIAGNAIVAWGYSDWLVTGNNIESAGQRGQGCGIYLGSGSKNWIIRNNTILNCATDGIRLEQASYNTIDSNRVSGCSQGVNIADAEAAQNVVTSNDLAGNNTAFVDNGTGTTKSNNILNSDCRDN